MICHGVKVATGTLLGLAVLWMPLTGNADEDSFPPAVIDHLVYASPTLAEILLKKRNGAAGLSDVEGIRWEKYELGMLDIWALAHSRYDRNLLSEEQWVAWDRYFTHIFSKEAESITRGRWRELSYGYETGFWNHVGEALFGTAASAE